MTVLRTYTRPGLFDWNNYAPFPAPIAGPAFVPQGVRFDGSTQYMQRGANLTGVADNTKTGIISFWFKMMGGDGGNAMIFEDSTLSNMQIFRQADNLMRVNSAATAPLFFNTISTFLSAGAWRHLLASFNLTTGVAQQYIDGSSDIQNITCTDPGGLFIQLATGGITDWGFADRVGGSLLANIEVAEFYLAFGQYDTVPNLLPKFRSGGHPVDLGSDGSTPTGTAPHVYFSYRGGDLSPNSFATNRGNGGPFTITNPPLAASSTNP